MTPTLHKLTPLAAAIMMLGLSGNANAVPATYAVACDLLLNAIGPNGLSTAVGTGNCDYASATLGNFTIGVPLVSPGNLTVTGTSLLSGASTLDGGATINNGATINGGAAVTGALSSTGNTTLGTGASTVNTIGNAGTSNNTLTGLNNTITSTNTTTLQAGSNAVTINAGTSGAAPAVSINGVVSAANTSNIGVLISGSGQNGIVYDPASGLTPTWSDVTIQSANYGGIDPSIGSAIKITDYGVQIISPITTAGQIIQNNSGGNSGAGQVINNTGGNSGSGNTTNNLGNNSSTTGGTVNNNIGSVTGGNGSATNVFGQNNGTGNATNTFGGGTGTSTNNFGTGTGASTNNFGNSNAATTVGMTAGSSTMNMSNGQISMSTGGLPLASNGTGTPIVGSAAITMYNTPQTIAPNTTIGNLLNGVTYQNQINGNLYIDGNAYINGSLNYVSGTSATTTVTSGVSILPGAALATTGQVSIVNSGGTGALVDGNGKITTGVTNQSTASLTLTNGLGNTHGMVVTESSTVISGGTHSTSLTFNNNDVTFSNAQTGAPVQVHGVADGTSAFDAVNVRQFAGAISGVAAMTNIPGVDTNKSGSIGVGVGNFMGYSSIAFGGSVRLPADGVLRASLSSGLNGGSGQKVVGLGAGWSW